MGKIRKEWDSEFKQWITFDEDDVVDGTPELGIKMIKSGALGREAQYRYFSEHPDEVENQKLFSELKKECGDDNIEET